MSFETILVAGASRGIGLAVAEHLVARSDRLLAVARTPAPIGEWIQADLSELAGVETVATAIGDDRLDALLYMVRAYFFTNFIWRSEDERSKLVCCFTNWTDVSGSV